MRTEDVTPGWAKLPSAPLQGGSRAGAHLLVALLAGGAWSAAGSREVVRAAPWVEFVAERPLPGRATRFDYQDLDERHGHLVVAHMGDDEVLVLALRDGSTVARFPGIGTVRGIRVAAEADLILATAAATDELVRIDASSLSVIGRSATGSRPDGVDYDPLHRIVGVSDQRDGAISLIADAGAGPRRQVRLGLETGNVAFDRRRGWFWITVVRRAGADRLVAVEPTTGEVESSIDLPGCVGAHGLRLHPDGASALVACEESDLLARVALAPPFSLVTAPTGTGPDVLALDPGLGRLYVAAERGDLAVFDVSGPGLHLLGRVHAGEGAHTVAVDPQTHRVFVPLAHGASGEPVLRMGRPP